MTNRLSETNKPMEAWRRQIIQGNQWLRVSSKPRTEDGKSARQANWVGGPEQQSRNNVCAQSIANPGTAHCGT